MITTDYKSSQIFTDQPVAELVEFLSTNVLDSGNREKADKLTLLKNDIGDELFNSLSSEDKDFILDTVGSVDFGYKLNSDNLREIERSLREDYEE